MHALEPDDWLETVDETAPGLQWRLSRALHWIHPERFLELGAELAPVTPATARHASACCMRLEETDRLILGPTTDLRRLEPLLQDHSPILIMGAESNVAGNNVDERLKKLMTYSGARFAWMTMLEGRIRWSELFPRNLDFTGIFDNISSSEELMSFYREAIPFYRDDAFCSVTELLGA
jgi:hypothetical protein